MKKALLSFAIGLAAVAVGLISSADTSQGAFHLMRVYGVLGGALSDPNIQYVELRLTDFGQNQLANPGVNGMQDICFFDAGGVPYARFTFTPPNPANAADEASVLIATAEFDTNWPAGSPDYTFSAANTTAIAGGADVLHPMRAPAGKVAFGSDSQSTPSLMCQAGFSVIDSIAYGIGYTGSVNFGTRFNTDLPNTGTNAALLQGPICFPGSPSTPCGSARDNSVNYALTDVNTVPTNPRNNSGQSSDISAPIPADADGDGVPDISDNCPDWPNPAQNLPTWTVPAGDTDCDGFPTTTTVFPRGAEGFMTTDGVDYCADTTTFFDEEGPLFGEPLSPWPPDVNDNRQANLSDIVAFGPTFNKASPDPLYNARYDLNASSSVNLSDLVAFGPFFNLSCTP